MAIFGPIALGVVMGWVSALVGRGTGGPLGVSWRALAFAAFALAGAAFLTFFYDGWQGAGTTAIAFAGGALAAAALFGIAGGSATGQRGG